MCPRGRNARYHSPLHASPYRTHFDATKTAAKILQLGFYWPILFRDCFEFVKTCDHCQRVGNISKCHELPLNNILEVVIFDVWRIDFMEPFSPSFGQVYILLVVDYVSKWVEPITNPINDAWVVFKFLHQFIFTKYGTSKAIISNEAHFCNKMFDALLAKYVKHKVALAYHP